MNDDAVPKSPVIVAVSLLTAEELRNVGTSLKRIYPVPYDGTFDDLLKVLDGAASGQAGNVIKFPGASRTCK